jgi:hypothetical protein
MAKIGRASCPPAALSGCRRDGVLTCMADASLNQWRRQTALALSVVFGVLVVSCDERALPTQPTGRQSSPSQGPQAPRSTGPALGLIGIELSGPSTTTPGQPVQFTATVRLEDGTLKDGSSDPAILWRSSDPSVIQVTQTGLATPLVSQGAAGIHVEIKGDRFGRSATRELLVLPPGTFRLIGTVYEEGVASISIPGARVEVVSGTPVSFTNQHGGFVLYGVPPVADIRISADATVPEPFLLNSQATSSAASDCPSLVIGRRCRATTPPSSTWSRAARFPARP